MRHKDRRPRFEGLDRPRGEGAEREPGGRSGRGEAAHRHGHREGRARRGGPPGRGRSRAQRGDIRTGILLLLADQPMHGYQIMQAMSERTGGAWRPSPGAVYPTIAQLEDEGLVTTQEEGGRRLVTLTSDGQAYLEEHGARLGDPFANFGDRPSGPDLRDSLHELHAAARQIAVTGDLAQVGAAAQVLAQARRSLYLILAGEPNRTAE